jgi:beta-phosphoglucomutase-like phosphatase (HAD superfamily)
VTTAGAGSPEAIVFDFDGVLADTEPLHLRAFQQALAPSGVTLETADYYARYLGFDDSGVFEALSLDRGLGWTHGDVARLRDAKARGFRTILETHPVLFDGVAERLREWAGQVPFAIASGALREEIELVLEASGLRSFFPIIIAAGETPSGKPAPDPYLAALGRLGAEARRSVAVEDSVCGIESAHRAGMKVVAVATSYPPDRLTEADATVAAFGDLTLARFAALARR